MKKIVFAVTVLAFVFTSLAPVFAEPDGNKRKGKYTYRKVYKACMERGEVDAPKPLVNPDAHTQAEWTQIFDSKAFAEFKCAPEWEALNDTQLLDIYTYLWSFAADSPTPAKCK